jgi:hypothetical protein
MLTELDHTIDYLARIGNIATHVAHWGGGGGVVLPSFCIGMRSRNWGWSSIKTLFCSYQGV